MTAVEFFRVLIFSIEVEQVIYTVRHNYRTP